MNEKRVALYMRISSTVGQSVESQRVRLERYCVDRNWTPVKEYVDEGYSRDQKKPSLEKLIKEAKEGKFDSVCVHSLSRLGSSLQQVLATVATLSKDYGINIISITENIDTSDESPYSELFMSVIVCMSRMELTLHRERSRAGIANYIKNGGRMGRPQKTYDFKRCLDLINNYGISQNQAAKAEGISPSLLSKHMKKWNLLSLPCQQAMITDEKVLDKVKA